MENQPVIRMTIAFANLLEHINQSYLNLYLRSLLSGLSICVFFIDLLPRVTSHILLDFGIYVFKNSDSYFLFQNSFSFFICQAARKRTGHEAELA
jgi:hypothetical protein